MKVTLILKKVNKQLDDEGLSVDDIVGYLDSAISEINRECYAIYPTFTALAGATTVSNLDYNVIPDTWIDSIVIPYVCAKYKIQDDENPVFFMNDYNKALRDMLHTYNIPTTYQDADRRAMLYGGNEVVATRTFSGGGW